MALTGRSQIDYVINSHWHSDHVRGNLAFPDAAVVATERTRELIRALPGTPATEHAPVTLTALLLQVQPQMHLPGHTRQLRALTGR